MAKQWVNFIHIPLALTSYFALTIIIFSREAVKSVFSMLWFTIWGTVEMVGVSIILFSVNYNWRRHYEQATVPEKNIFKQNIEFFFSIWDSMFFVLLIAFFTGTLFFAWATWKTSGLEKVLSCLLWLAVPLTILIILENYAYQDWAGQVAKIAYPILQPVSRFVLGLLIWKTIAKQKKSTPETTI